MANIFIYILLPVTLFFVGMPVAFSLGVTALAALLVKYGLNIPFDIIVQRMAYGINNFTILSVPFFLFAGKVMNRGGVTHRLFDFADVAVGHIKGGLGHTNIMASVLFAGMSGTAVSDAAGLGLIEIEAMREKKYDVDFSAAVTAASSTIGPIIPPSVPMVFYAVQAGASVGALFIGGIIPGLLMALTMMVMVYSYASKGKCPPPRPRPTAKEFFVSLRGAILPMLTPVIILVGIYTGWFTPTEAAVIASTYALFLSVVVYRDMTFKALGRIIIETARDSACMAFIVAVAYIYGWLIVTSGIPMKFSEALISLTTNKYIILLLINIFLLFVGCFLDGVVAIMILAPILTPVVTGLGVDVVHFGLIMVLNLMIGMITPPYGMVLFVTAKVSGRPLYNIIKATTPFLIPLIITLLLVTYFPPLVTFLPSLFQ